MYKLDDLTKQLKDKGISLCGCIGAINGQLHCPCKMARLVKEDAEKCNAYEHDPFEADLINRPISKL